VREAALWVSGAALAFFVTAGAFLLLANLGSGPSEKSLAPDPRPAQSGSALELSLDEDQLASLEALPGQRFDVAVENTGEDDLAYVNLTLKVSSENTALPDVRYYRQTVNKLSAGESVSVPFYLDLSAQEDTNLAAVPEPSRRIVEVRATAPAGVSETKTAILPLRDSP
jgi:hypothetical protein